MRSEKIIYYGPSLAPPPLPLVSYLVGGFNAQTPDVAGMAITAAVNFTAKVRIKTSPGTSQYLASKKNVSSNMEWEWQPAAGATGNYFARFSTTGTALVGTFCATAAELAAAGYQDGATIWLGHVIDPATGTVQCVISTNGVYWSNIGTPSNVGATTIFDGTMPVRVGTDVLGNPWQGRIYEMSMRSGAIPGAGAIVWRFDPSECPLGATVFTDARGTVWTLSSADAIAKGYV